MSTLFVLTTLASAVRLGKCAARGFLMLTLACRGSAQHCACRASVTCSVWQGTCLTIHFRSQIPEKYVYMSWKAPRKYIYAALTRIPWKQVGERVRLGSWSRSGQLFLPSYPCSLCLQTEWAHWCGCCLYACVCDDCQQPVLFVVYTSTWSDTAWVEMSSSVHQLWHVTYVYMCVGCVVCSPTCVTFMTASRCWQCERLDWVGWDGSIMAVSAAKFNAAVVLFVFYFFKKKPIYVLNCFQVIFDFLKCTEVIWESGYIFSDCCTPQ